MNKPHFKTVYVQAEMVDIGEYVDHQVQKGTKLVTKTKKERGGLFKKAKYVEYTEEVPVYETKREWRKTGKSDREIDIAGLTQKINEICNSLAHEGYEINQLIPINSGKYRWQTNTDKGWRFQGINNGGYGYGWGWGWGWGYGYGYGITDKVIILAQLKKV